MKRIEEKWFTVVALDGARRLVHGHCMLVSCTGTLRECLFAIGDNLFLLHYAFMLKELLAYFSMSFEIPCGFIS